MKIWEQFWWKAVPLSLKKVELVKSTTTTVPFTLIWKLTPLLKAASWQAGVGKHSMPCAATVLHQLRGQSSTSMPSISPFV